jgi:uncharacterized protein (TIGR01777 family)
MVKPRLFINASAIGIYNPLGEIHTEESQDFSSGFVYDLTRQWEDTAMKSQSKNTKVLILRIGLVLSAEGGLLERLIPLFRWGLGGRIGNGRQAFSWIHIADLVRAIEFLIERNASGIFNMTAPGWTNNREMTKILARALHRPAIASVPKWALQLRYGRAAETIVSGPAVLPRNLMEKGFRFSYPELEPAIRDIVN